MDFQRAAEIAIQNARVLLPKAKDFELEGIMIENYNYEVTLSYLIEGQDPLMNSSTQGSIGALLKVMGRRREEKVFIVSQSGDFKGFRNVKN